MRKYFALLMVALGLCTQGFAYDQAQSSDNYYVQPGGVFVAPNGIFVMIESHLVQVDMLCTDENGVFVPGIEMSRQFAWCPHCGGWYDPDHPERHNCPGPR